jgi:hypothetical protein
MFEASGVSSPAGALTYAANIKLQMGIQTSADASGSRRGLESGRAGGAAAIEASASAPDAAASAAAAVQSGVTYTTLQRVVFEHGHCLLPQQRCAEDYLAMFDADVQRVAGAVLSVHDTGTRVPLPGQKPITLCMENLCGMMKIQFENVPSAGAILRPGAPRVSNYVKNRQFIGTHHLLHTVHGRLAYRVEHKTWSFKGCRSLPDLVDFMRNLLEDYESAVFPVVNMLSVTLRTDTALVIDPLHSLLQRVLEKVFCGIVAMQQRVDDINNLFFMDVVSWPRLLAVVEQARRASASVGNTSDDEVENVRSYLRHNCRDASTHPTVSIGFTRHGCWFIRITFSRGCVCAPTGSVGSGEGGGEPPGMVSAGGVEPFVQVVVRFIMLLLVKMRAVGSGS